MDNKSKYFLAGAFLLLNWPIHGDVFAQSNQDKCDFLCQMGISSNKNNEVAQKQEKTTEAPLLKGPFLIRGGTTYDQKTREPITGRMETFYNNGVMRKTGVYENGRPSGLIEEYHENGQLRTLRNYTQGTQEGIFEEYDENGQLLSSGSYKNGKMDGEWNYYDANGVLSEAVMYLSGEKVGDIEETLGPDGRILSKTYRSVYGDLISIKIFEYHGNGKIKEVWTSYFESKIAISETFSESGILLEFRSTKNTTPHGEIARYYSTGEPMHVGFYEEGKLLSFEAYDKKNQKIINAEIEDFDQGMTVYKASIKNGKLEGTEKSFFSSGQLKAYQNYENGYLEGLGEEYYESGQLRAYYNFKGGLLNGIEEYFHGNGQLMYSQQWISGKIEGPVTRFDQDGELSSIQEYKNGEPHGFYTRYKNGEVDFKSCYINGEYEYNKDELCDDL